jgi:hypothetical protein
MTEQKTPDEIAAEQAAVAGAQGVDTDTTSAEVAPRAQRPTLNRMVIYSDRQIPDSQRSAVVVGTRESISHDEGVPLPTDDMHVHLLVFPPQGAAYNAIDVEYNANGGPNTWRWPSRVGA